MPNLPDESKCYGCAACKNACPMDAISFEYSGKGFLFYNIDKSKCIDCGKCEKACPSLNPVFENDKEPEFWAFQASNSIREVSSSGGAFSAVADYVFANHGLVCGAAWDRGLKLRHQFAISDEYLDSFRGSKYMQSEIGLAYREIKKQLERDEMILFVGTPCQVAGLKGYLGKPYEKLITMDLLCHGVPSQLFFKSYISEVSKNNGKQVQSIDFRDKKTGGWSYSKHLIVFEDGSRITPQRNGKTPDSYMTAFNKNLMMRYTCYNCQFCDYPRQGDLTIGDLWESEKLCPGVNDKKGTSFVFINNSKGKKVFDCISEKAVLTKQIEISGEDYQKLPNRVRPKTRPHDGRRRFLDLVKVLPFSKAVSLSMDHHWDIGLLSAIYTDNIGSVLTYYALYKTLTDMGFTVLQIEKTLDSTLTNYDKSVEFVKRWIPTYDKPVQRDSIFDLYNLNDVCDSFVVGSDQIFMEDMLRQRGSIYLCEFVKSDKRIIAYSSSFGGPGARGSKEFNLRLKYYLERFSALSCREDNGIEFGDSLGLPKIDWNLDPVFLCNVSHYKRILNAYKNYADQAEPYVFSYVVRPLDRIALLTEKVARTIANDQVKCAIHRMDKRGKGKLSKYQCHDAFPIEQTLSELYHSKYVITDSFHGVCFAIIFKKDFVCIPRDFEDRFVSLLSRIGLTDRIIHTNLDNFDDKMLEPIDYVSVYEKLMPLIETSKRWLKDALGENNENTSLQTFDVLYQLIAKQHNDILELQKDVQLLKSEH